MNVQVFCLPETIEFNDGVLKKSGEGPDHMNSIYKSIYTLNDVQYFVKKCSSYSEIYFYTHCGPNPDLTVPAVVVPYSGAMVLISKVHGMDLLEAFNLNDSVFRYEDMVVKIFSSLRTKVADFHALYGSHGDIKPENIVTDDIGCIKLIDFECFCPNTKPQLGNSGGTYGFMSLEKLLVLRDKSGECYDRFKDDLYAMSTCLFNCVMLLSSPSQTDSFIEVLQTVQCKDQVQQYWTKVHVYFTSLFKQEIEKFSIPNQQFLLEMLKMGWGPTMK